MTDRPPWYPQLIVVVPTRGRPDNLRRVVAAWDETQAWDVAELLVARDADDPQAEGYAAVVRERRLMELVLPVWLPMVHKLDQVAVAAANDVDHAPFALGFAGDDHLPRTVGWAKTYVDTLRELGTGIVFGDDGYQRQKCPTQWAMTADIVTALGRMVPAPVEHMYSDVSILDVGKAAGCIRYLPDVFIEHMHPIVKKAASDEQYQRVNSREQFRRDFDLYKRWKRTELHEQVAKVRALRGASA